MKQMMPYVEPDQYENYVEFMDNLEGINEKIKVRRKGAGNE